MCPGLLLLGLTLIAVIECDEYLHLWNVFFIIISYKPQKPPEITSENLVLKTFCDSPQLQAPEAT